MPELTALLLVLLLIRNYLNLKRARRVGELETGLVEEPDGRPTRSAGC